MRRFCRAGLAAAAVVLGTWTQAYAQGTSRINFAAFAPRLSDIAAGNIAAPDHAAAYQRQMNQVTASQAATESVFPNPDKALDFSYSVGGAWAYVPIGRYPITNEDGLSLDGNYGVMYTVRLHLDNPTARKTDVRVIFEPRAGEARAVFLINGALTETPATFPPAEVRVMTVPLAAHQRKTVTLVTMPAAGGSYPAALIVHN